MTNFKEMTKVEKITIFKKMTNSKNDELYKITNFNEMTNFEKITDFDQMLFKNVEFREKWSISFFYILKIKS